MNLLLGTLEASITGGLAVLVVCIFSALYGSRFRKRTKMFVWFLIVVRLLLPIHFEMAEPAVTVQMPVVSLKDPVLEEPKSDKEEDIELLKAVYREIILDSIPFLDRDAVEAADSRGMITSGHVMLLTWLVGAVLFSGYYAGMYYIGRERTYGRSFECTDAGVLAVLEQNAEILKVRRPPTIRILEDRAQSPFTMGIWNSTIFLPDKEYEEKELHYILRHELVHCKNKDVLKKGIVLAANAIHWFNPFVWLMRRLINQDMEMLCDEEVVGDESKVVRREYSEVIMTCIMEENAERNVLSTSFVHGTEFVKRRLNNIFDARQKKAGVACIAGVCGIVLLLGCALQIEEEPLQDNTVRYENGQQSSAVMQEIDPKATTEAPTEAEVLEKRELVLAGMSEEDIDYLKAVVKSANLSMERDYLYGSTLSKMEEPDSLAWNYIDHLGEIQIGWAYDTEDLAKKEELNMSDEEFNRVYGKRVVADNEVDGATFIVHMTEIKDKISDESLKRDFDALIWNMEQAMETHDVDYLYQIYRIFHDMDYYLLRYGPKDMAAYVRDMSTVEKYYGVLEVYR